MSDRGPRASLWAVGLLIALACACDRGQPRSGGGSSADETGDDLTGGELVFEDDFSRSELGDHWSTESREAWTILDGGLRGLNARNSALWLDIRLPEQVRVEVDATAHSEDGDLKFEIFADGHTHESGYIAIYGGWTNSVTCIAKLGEHNDAERLNRNTHDRVEAGRTYRFTAVRTDHRFRWYIDDELILSYDDEAPLTGPNQRYFGFNNWQAPVEFDNLRIFDLSD